MALKKLVAQGVAASLLGLSALGAAVVPAAADPWQPDWDNHNGSWHDRGYNWQSWRDWRQDQWQNWWSVNRWRNDDRPPWGWGAPPPVYWRGNPPASYNYWGYNVYPTWYPEFHAWGFWLFGIFIPIIVTI